MALTHNHTQARRATDEPGGEKEINNNDLFGHRLLKRLRYAMLCYVLLYELGNGRRGMEWNHDERCRSKTAREDSLS